MSLICVRAKFILARRLAERRDECRASAYNTGYQELLFGPNAAPETSFVYAFTYDPNVYPAKWHYRGRNRFEKHFYPIPMQNVAIDPVFDTDTMRWEDKYAELPVWRNKPIVLVPKSAVRIYPAYNYGRYYHSPALNQLGAASHRKPMRC